MIKLGADVILVWTILTIVCLAWSIEINWTKYELEHTLNEFSCASSEYLLVQNDVPDLFDCSNICYLTNDCIGAEYNTDSLQCIGCTTFRYQGLPRSENVKLFSRRDYYIDCKHVLAKGEHSKSGVYEIRLYSSETIDVYCDMETFGGGWTTIQRRFDDSIDFEQNFTAYEDGFGDVDSDFWLGLRSIQELTIVPSELILLAGPNSKNQIKYLKYDGFYLTGEYYKIHADQRAESSQHPLPTAPFYTYDRDTALNCAQLTGGGWWFPNNHIDCNSITLNGKYDPPFAHFQGFKKMRMMIRRP